MKKLLEKVAMTKFVIMCLICFILHGIESAAFIKRFRAIKFF